MAGYDPKAKRAHSPATPDGPAPVDDLLGAPPVTPDEAAAPRPAPTPAPTTRPAPGDGADTGGPTPGPHAGGRLRAGSQGAGRPAGRRDRRPLVLAASPSLIASIALSDSCDPRHR